WMAACTSFTPGSPGTWSKCWARSRPRDGPGTWSLDPLASKKVLPVTPSCLWHLITCQSEVQLQIDQLRQNIARYGVTEVTVAEEFEIDVGLPAGRSKIAEKRPVRREAIHELRHRLGEPLVFDRVAHAVAPSRVPIFARQQCALG